MGQLNDHVQPEGPGLLLHRPVTQGDDHLVDIGNDPGILMTVIVKLRLGSGTQAQSGSNSGSVTQAQ